MRIGVDTRSLSEPISGIGRYTLSLLELMVLDESHEWVLYSHRPILQGQWNLKNVTVRTLSFPKWFRGLYIPWTLFVLPFWVKQDNIDIFWSPAHRLPIFLSKSIASVVTIHDLVWKHAPETMRPFGKFLDSSFMPKSVEIADKVIAVSKSTAQDLYNEVPQTKQKTRVIYEAGPLAFRKVIKHKTINKKYLLFVGTLEPRKNLPRLLEAYSLLPLSYKKEYSFYIVGGKGWGKDDIGSIVEYLNIKRYVKILGYLSDKELAKIYQEASLFVMPSLYEGFGLPLLEAMSFGVPIVTSNISSMPEIVGNAAILADPYSVNSIKEGIKKILTDEQLRSLLSTAGIKQSKKFSWKIAAKKTLLVFTEAISNRQGNNF
ncbi:glycosyltransferase family 1 protein [Methylophilaceae bacterium Uisw_099_01]